MAEKEEHKPLSRSVESLGWLSQSGVQPKKQRLIEGVSASSLVAFKAELYKVQKEQQDIKEGRLDLEELKQRRKGLAGILERKNAGVTDRDTKDRLELKTDSDRASEAYAALEKKAQLYEKLTRGHMLDDEERYEVDFLMKGRREGGEEAGPVDTAELAAFTSTGGLRSADMDRERERRAWEEEAVASLTAAELREQQREQRRQLLDEVIDETEADKQRAAEQKRQRQEAEQAKRERLKAAFLRKKLESMRAKQAGSKQPHKQQAQQQQ